MWPGRYFPERYFARRYWAKVGASSVHVYGTQLIVTTPSAYGDTHTTTATMQEKFTGGQG